MEAILRSIQIREDIEMAREVMRGLQSMHTWLVDHPATSWPGRIVLLTCLADTIEDRVEHLEYLKWYLHLCAQHHVAIPHVTNFVLGNDCRNARRPRDPREYDYLWR